MLFRFDRLKLGVRGRAAGPWINMDGDGVSAEVKSYAGWVEASYDLIFGFSAMAAGGVAYERVRARPDGTVFAGPSETAVVSKPGALFRFGAAFHPGLGDTFDAVIAFGIQALTSSLTVQLPPPYSSGRVPIDRGTWSPFLSLGVAVDL